MVISKPILTAIVAAAVAAGASGAYLLRGTGAEAPVVEAADRALERSAGPGANETPDAPEASATEALPPPPAPVVTAAEAADRPAAPRREPAPRSVEVPREVEEDPAVVLAEPAPAEAEAEAPQPVSVIPALPIPATPTVLAGALPDVVLEELVVGTNSVIGLRVATSISSETAVIEDTVEARVSRDVMVGGQVAVPSGSVAVGSVTLVDQGGRLRDPARLSVRFHTLRLPDGARVEIDSDPIHREGDAPGDESAATIGGGAIGGAIIGGILGGARGALIGGTAGAGAGTAAAMATGNDPAVLAAGTQVTIRLLRPFSVVVERQPSAR